MYTVFPNTVLVFHPDWVSRITVFPDGTDNSVVHHDMLVPAEDIAACENIQQAARSGADEKWITGGLEST